jgi:hypothetical protein
MKLYEQFLLDHTNINETGAPAMVGTAIAAVMGLSALTNVYISYKERVREYGRTLNECKEKCEIRHKLNNSKIYSDEDKKKLMQNKQDCINKCEARYYKNVKDAEKKKKEIKQKIQDKMKELKAKKDQFTKKGK